MIRPRIIPVLLLSKLGLVKSVKFKDHRYIGDPINAVKIFNDKKADELAFLDISAEKENRCIPIEFVHKVGDEANMPFAVGGGIKTIDNIRDVLNHGAEKVIINTEAYENPDFIKRAADTFGSSTITVCIDVKKKLFGKEKICIAGGSKEINEDPVSFAQKMVEYGAGEIIIQSIDKDGTNEGYDLELIKKISVPVSVPVIAMGGAGKYSHFKQAVNVGMASAVAAGSIFVFHGPRKAVLISYPTKQELKEIFE
jgi:cyclase